jgi:hypothetical protein
LAAAAAAAAYTRPVSSGTARFVGAEDPVGRHGFVFETNSNTKLEGIFFNPTVT